MADDDCDVVVSAGVFCLFYMDEDEQDINLEQRKSGMLEHKSGNISETR